MLKVTSETLELRGISSSTSKKGNAYYTINAETRDGSPYQFYCPHFEALPQGMKKGEFIRIIFEVKYFKGNERLEVHKVEKVVDGNK